jgi:hypothetical protein
VRFPVWVPAVAIGIVLVLAIGFVGMMRMEETDTFCASCHTQPESTYVERVKKDAVDAASKHMIESQTHCIDCHSGPGLVGRAGAILLGARNAVMYVTKTMKQPAELTVPIADGNCVKCHQDILESKNYKGNDNHYHYFMQRWQQVKPDQAGRCVDCHNGHILNGDASLGFISKDTTEKTCNKCHNTLGGE